MAARKPSALRHALRWAGRHVGGPEGRDLLEEAVVLYRRVLELRPGDVGTTVNLAVVLQQLGRNEEAVRVLTASLDVSPRSPSLLARRSRVWMDRSDPGRARRDAATAVELDPGHAEAHFALGLLAHADGDVPAAIAHFAAPQRVPIRGALRPLRRIAGVRRPRFSRTIRDAGSRLHGAHGTPAPERAVMGHRATRPIDVALSGC